MSPSPVITRCAAMAMVWSPDEQKRLTVIPAVVTGQPARMAICRAMLRPVAPSGFAQPTMTSSISAGSTCARSIAWRRTWPPIVAPWVMLNAPFQLLQSGVRAVETMTASGMSVTLTAFADFGIHCNRMAVDGYIEQDAHGIITAWSPESEELFGWSGAEAVGMRSHRLIPERNRARHERALASFMTAAERPIQPQDMTALHNDGRE